MSFQAYLKALADKAGVYSPDMKATALVAWLKKEFALEHGHSMAIWAVFKEKGWVDPKTGNETGNKTGNKTGKK